MLRLLIPQKCFVANRYRHSSTLRRDAGAVFVAIGMRRRDRDVPRDENPRRVIDAHFGRRDDDDAPPLLDSSEQRDALRAFDDAIATHRRRASALLGASGLAIGVGWFWGRCALGALGGGDVWARCPAHRSVYGERASAKTLVLACDALAGGTFALSGAGCWRLRVGDDAGDAAARRAGRAATRLGAVAGGLWVVAAIAASSSSGATTLQAAVPVVYAWLCASVASATAEQTRTIRRLRASTYAHKKV